MRVITYLGRSLAFHWRSHLAVALGVLTATATLTGALLVGDSMRTSLREFALARLGSVDQALIAERFFNQRVASALSESSSSGVSVAQACPAILASGGIVHAETRARVNRITVLGVDDDFWELAIPPGSARPTMPTGRSVILNAPLADQLGAGPGDDVLVRIGKPSPISTETLLGRRDDTSVTLRLTVHGIVPVDGGGSFALEPGQSLPNNAWVPLLTLQRALDQTNRINAILVESGASSADESTAATAALQETLQRRVTPTDLGLRLRTDPDRGYAALESDSLLLAPVIEESALAAANSAGIKASPMLTYLANSITVISKAPDDPANPQSEIRNPQSVVPYSTVTALDTTDPDLSRLTLVDGSPAPRLETGDILLNQWAANDLGVAVGDRIVLTYYVPGPFGQLVTQRSSFVLRGIVRMDDFATDPGFTPPYPGVTDTKNLADWDPPFPIDLSVIREKDEEYWDRFAAAPKAFISLTDGRRLWTEEKERFGRATSIRLVPSGQTDLLAVVDTVDAELPRHLNVIELGLAFEPVRARALAASTGSTDFGMLFVSFSFFLIISAAMLVALLFGLGAERRASEIGLLLATGFPSSLVTRLLVAEGAAVAGLGAAAGLIAAVGYAWLMLAGLKSRWSEAANAPFLQLHTPPLTFIIGFGASLIIAVAAIAWSVRRLGRCPARALLAGVTSEDRFTTVRRRSHRTVDAALFALVAALTLVILPAVTDAVPETVGFFGGGAALVVACLCFLRIWLYLERPTAILRPRLGAIFRLGVRNAPRHPGRSLLAAGLIATATFVIAAIGAFRVDPNLDTIVKHSSTGGFALVAESAIPLPFALGTSEGRDALGMPESAADKLDDVTVVPFRLRPGDEASCRGLYRPTKPRIIGAPDRMIERGGFVFAATLAKTESEEQNPWTLLNRTFPDGAVPVIAEESAVLWRLHLGLGQDLVITDERGREKRLRFVALLARCALQDELIVAEEQFVRLFPSISGRAFFLLDVPERDVSELSATLERELSTFALDVTTTARRLADYSTVQNTYLRTFQTLGGLGLVLGTVGLTVVLLRNVVERRNELALMRALGFSYAAIGRMVLAENALLVVAGLVAGAGPALVAIAPHVISRPAQVPWLSLGLTLLVVAAVGIGAGAIALVPTLRAPILPALRRE